MNLVRASLQRGRYRYDCSPGRLKGDAAWALGPNNRAGSSGRSIKPGVRSVPVFVGQTDFFYFACYPSGLFARNLGSEEGCARVPDRTDHDNDHRKKDRIFRPSGPVGKSQIPRLIG